MIRRFRVENFMCLKDVTVDLGQLTIFVGPNSSGKSALFKALTTFTRLLYFPVRGAFRGDFNVEPGVTLDEVAWGGDTALPITFTAWLSDNSTSDSDYTLELRRSYAGWSVTKEKFLFQGQWLDTSLQPFTFPAEQGTKSWPGPYTATLPILTSRYGQDTKAGPYLASIRELRDRLGSARRYRPSASDIASFVKPYNRPPTGRTQTRPPDADEAGKGFSLALQNVWKSDRLTFDHIQDGVRRLHPHITALDFVSDWRGTGVVYKTDRVRFNTPASLESDGVNLSSFLLWRLYTARPNLKLCLEEPENGVPIATMKQRYQLLKQFAEGVDENRNMQILVATHSRDFLNAIGSRNAIMDEIRVTEFSPDTGTIIHTLNHYREIDQLLTEFRYQMGDLWWSNRLSQHKLTS
jgi:predicted ATPase